MIGKQWSTERFAELAARLSAPNGLFANARIAIFAAEAERDQVQALFDNLPKDSFDDLVGVGDLSDVAHLLSRCDFFVGNDPLNAHVRGVGGSDPRLIWPKPNRALCAMGAEMRLCSHEGII